MVGPLLLIAIPIAAALIALLLRGINTASALVAALIPLALALWLIQTPLNEPQVIFGRTVVLDNGDRFGLVYLFTVSAAILISVWRTSPRWTYYPIALLTLGALAAALIVRPPLNEIYPTFIYSAIFVTIAAALSVFPLQGGQPGVANSVLRFITIVALALPALLMADWTLGQFTQSPDSPEIAQASVTLVALGFALLLAVVPFHNWLPAVARDAPPLSTAFVVNVVLGAVWILLLDVLNGNRLIAADARTFEFLRGAGLLMAAFGGLAAWAQRDFGRLLGYSLIADMGASLFAVGTSSRAGLAAAIIIVITRSVGSTLMAMGMSLARARYARDDFSVLNGLVWRSPWASLAIIIGGLSLAGFPPLAGFAGRWGIIQEAINFDARIAAVLLASGIGVVIGVLRGLREMLHAPPEEAEPPPPESRGEIAIVVIVIGVCLIVGLFPGLLAPFVREFVASYTFFVR